MIRYLEVWGVLIRTYIISMTFLNKKVNNVSHSTLITDFFL